MSTRTDQGVQLVSCCCCFELSGFLQLVELGARNRDLELWTACQEQVVHLEHLGRAGDPSRREKHVDLPLDPALHGLLWLLGSQDLPGQNRGHVSPSVTSGITARVKSESECV